MIERKQVPFTFGPDRSIRGRKRSGSEVSFARVLVWFGREFVDACERIGSSSWFVVAGVAVALCILWARAQGWLT